MPKHTNVAAIPMKLQCVKSPTKTRVKTAKCEKEFVTLFCISKKCVKSETLLANMKLKLSH